MPNRIIKESICTSENIDQLSAFQEIFFYRLIVNCDDYGRMDARPKILSSRLFPLKDVDTDEINSALKALASSELVILYEVDSKPYLQMKTWDRHQQVRAKRSKYPSPYDGILADENICKQMISDDIKCYRYPIQSLSESLSESESFSLSESLIDDDDAVRIQLDHNRVLDAAEDAGFKMSNDVRATLINLYAEYGLDKMLEGFKSCAEYGVLNLAYLKACLKGEPKKPKGKTVIAQQYDQRDYSRTPEEERKHFNSILEVMEGAMQ